MAGADPLLPGVYFVGGEWMQNVVRIPGDACATGRLGRYRRQGLFGEDVRNESDDNIRVMRLTLTRRGRN